VQGHSGGSVLEISCVAAVPALACLVCMLVKGPQNKQKYFSNSIDAATLIIPVLFSLMGPMAPATVLALLAVTAAALLFLTRSRTMKPDRKITPVMVG